MTEEEAMRVARGLTEDGRAVLLAHYFHASLRLDQVPEGLRECVEAGLIKMEE